MLVGLPCGSTLSTAARAEALSQVISVPHGFTDTDHVSNLLSCLYSLSLSLISRKPAYVHDGYVLL